MATIDDALDFVSSVLPEPQWVDATVLYTVVTEATILNSGSILREICDGLFEMEHSWCLHLTIKQAGSKFQKVEITLNGADPDMDRSRVDAAVRALDSVLAFEPEENVKFNVNSGEVTKWRETTGSIPTVKPAAFPAPTPKEEND